VKGAITMPSYVAGRLVQEIRKRKKWTVSRLTNESQMYRSEDKDMLSTLSRMGKRDYRVRKETIEPIMEALDMPLDQFFCPYLENCETEVFHLRDELLYFLDMAEEGCKDALIYANVKKKQLKKKIDYLSGINRQFMLSCEARLSFITGDKPQETIEFIMDGLDCTFPDFDETSFKGEVLVFEEINLLHTLALTYERNGELNKAVTMLENICTGLRKLPEDDREKEKKLPKILLTLSNQLIKAAQYEKALDICEYGLKISIERNKGRYTPAFAYNKAVCFLHTGCESECKTLLQQAFFGYSLMGMKKQCMQVLEDAKTIFGITFKTYGVETLLYRDPVTTYHVKRGNSVVCNNVGEMLYEFRKIAGVKQKTLYEGVCSSGNYSKIESGQIQGDVYLMEHFMQRLGRDINLYVNTFVSPSEFKEKQLRNTLKDLLKIRKYDEAEKLLDHLKTLDIFKEGINLQTILNAEAALTYKRDGYTEKYNMIVHAALLVTIPHYAEEDIAKYKLSLNEKLLINKIAVHYGETNNTERAIRVFENLIASIRNSSLDEQENAKSYIMIMYNYSKYLGISKRYKESLKADVEGYALCVKYEHIWLSTGFAVNKACNYLEMEGKEKSIPYFAQAYYGSILIEDTEDVTIFSDYVKEHLDLIFE